ncbi:MAG: DNA-binding response regulator [Candidatus Electrothrix sp. AR4]|nr:DNA-binding response regulator [Candidatus Electrothrix sp. AR4]
MKKIVLIDDHDTFRASLRRLVSKHTDFKVVAEGADAQQGETAVRETQPDLAIVDLSLPDKSGIQLTRLIRTAAPHTGIIIVSMHSKIDYILNALRAGALGYLVKESVSDCLPAALEAAFQGEYYLDAALSREIAPRLLEISEPADIADETYGSLTAREQEIFRLLAQGNASGDIADKLCISAKTVTNHRANILSKLELHSTADLVRYAAKLGLLEDIG